VILKNVNRNLIFRIVASFVIVLAVGWAFVGANKVENMKLEANKPSYSKFLGRVQAGEIDSVVVTPTQNGSQELKIMDKKGVSTVLLANDPKMVESLIANKVDVSWKEIQGTSFLENFFFSWGPTLFFVGIFIWYMRKQAGGKGGAGGLFSMTKSKAELINPDSINVTFADVVGCDEAKLEAREFIDFLKSPDKFSRLGGRTPRGLLLTGPAGTGKTLLAKAIAKESGVPFFSTSGSDFVEMLVGLGAARVRDTFETAKKHAPCVLFIDEIDAIGGKRSASSFSGGQDEREQTLMQILVELDGMSTNAGVILVAATNRPEVLDPALLRPGRIDRQIMVQLPDVHGREEILKVHSKNVPLSKDVDLSRIARGTTGFSGAELANLINEGSIFAGRKGKQFVEQEDLQNAVDKIMMGPERPGLSMTQQDLSETAYHEAGHAIVARLLPNSDPVHKVTIVPRGRALGVTIQVPEKDRWSYKKEFLLERIAITMGGRAAEEIFCNTRTSGASNDISVATSIARSMVTEWGMSDLGPVAYGERNGGGFLGGGQVSMSNLSPEILKKVDDTIIEIINSQYDLAMKLLSENKDKVEAMVEALMDVETIDEWQVNNIMLGRHFNDQLGMDEYRQKQDDISKEALRLKESKKAAFAEKNKPVQKPVKIVDKINDNDINPVL
jgi:cell division protease FtsH